MKMFMVWDWNYEPEEARQYEADNAEHAAERFSEDEDMKGDYSRKRDVYVRDPKTNEVKVFVVYSEQTLTYSATEKD